MSKQDADAFYAMSQGLSWMAADEVAACRAAKTEKAIGKVHAAAYKRRAVLSELELARVRKLAGDPAAIQSVFERLGLPLVID